MLRYTTYDKQIVLPGERFRRSTRVHIGVDSVRSPNGSGNMRRVRVCFRSGREIDIRI